MFANHKCVIHTLVYFTCGGLLGISCICFVHTATKLLFSLWNGMMRWWWWLSNTRFAVFRAYCRCKQIQPTLDSRHRGTYRGQKTTKRANSIYVPLTLYVYDMHASCLSLWTPSNSEKFFVSTHKHQVFSHNKYEVLKKCNNMYMSSNKKSSNTREKIRKKKVK